MWVPEENVDVIVADGAVEALVPHLSAPEVAEGDEPVACEHEVEKDAALAIGLLAVKVQPRNPQKSQSRGHGGHGRMRTASWQIWFWTFVWSWLGGVLGY